MMKPTGANGLLKQEMTMTERGMIWILFLLILIFSFIDYIQTVMLLDLGAEEANGLLNMFVVIYGPNVIIILKMIPYVLLGITMFFFLRNKDKKQKEICGQCANNQYCYCKEKI